MKKLIESIDAARPEKPGSRYAIGYDDGLSKAKQILENAGVVSMGLHKAVMAERDIAIAQLEEHGIQFGANAPDVARVCVVGNANGLIRILITASSGTVSDILDTTVGKGKIND